MKKVKNILLIILISSVIYIYNNYKDDIYNYILGSVFINENNTLDEVKDYDGSSDFIYINNNVPEFAENDMYRDFEEYGELDYLGRCTYAYANVSKKLMPTKKRESIGMVKPTGWQTAKYDFIDGKFLYNRCHLIGYQLTGENANTKNLITCTRQMNTGIMLEYENMIASYIKKTNNHVLYKVTPIFENGNMLAKGVHMMGYSVEDKGKGIKFNIFIYNVQDKVHLDYKTGKSFISN